MKFTEELSWRNLIFDKTPGVEDFFSNENVTGYVGFDPTSKSLHVGNLLPIMNLVRLQSCLLYTSPSPRDRQKSRMPSSA